MLKSQSPFFGYPFNKTFLDSNDSFQKFNVRKSRSHGAICSKFQRVESETRYVGCEMTLPPSVLIPEWNTNSLSKRFELLIRKIFDGPCCFIVFRCIEARYLKLQQVARHYTKAFERITSMNSNIISCATLSFL